MREAIRLAWRSAGHTRPNPPVGAVVVKDGKIIGRGRHKKCGGAHAEAAALASVKDISQLKGATVYCTLEPCSRVGRVGACTAALIAAQVKRVVWACDDPNPVNKGRAARILRRAGIECKSGVCRAEAEPLIRPFTKHVKTGLPFVTVKIAMSLDGKICDTKGDAKWITAAATRRETGRLREVVDAIMVGAETVRRDDPSLLSHGRPNDDLLRVVVCSRAESVPPKAQILTDKAQERTIIAHGDGRRVDLTQLMKTLGAMGIMHVLCEGGLELARGLAAAGLVDEWITAVAPIVIGAGAVKDAARGRFRAAKVTAAGDIIATAEAVCLRG